MSYIDNDHYCKCEKYLEEDMRMKGRGEDEMAYSDINDDISSIGGGN